MADILTFGLQHVAPAPDAIVRVPEDDDYPHFGASVEEWDAWSAFCLLDLLPTVCDPQIPRHPSSKLKIDSPWKIPSRVYEDPRGWAGITAWSKHQTKRNHVKMWRGEPAHGICLNMRSVHAIDIDVEDHDLANEIHEYVESAVGLTLPVRRRALSARRLLLYRPTSESRLRSTNTPLRGGGLHGADSQIDWLCSGRQAVVAGRHHSGKRYHWDSPGVPHSLLDVPGLSNDEIDEIRRYIAEKWGVSRASNWATSVAESQERSAKQIDTLDARVKYIADHACYRDLDADGRLHVACPWVAEHKSSSGMLRDDTTETVYIPAGVGGYSHDAFVCQHAGCQPFHGNQAEAFLKAIDYPLFDEFEPMEVSPASPQSSMPALARNDRGIPLPTRQNLINALRAAEFLGYDLSLDEFAQTEMIRDMPRGQWRPITDIDFELLALALEAKRLRPPAVGDLSRMVSLVCSLNRRDSAAEWVESLTWDGVPRIDQFNELGLRAENDDYNLAVTRYLWTALVARILDPGCQADMTPIWTGAQGQRKSTMVRAMMPFRSWAGDINLNDRDTDLSRRLMGKAIGEIAELRGLRTRDEESIKAWLTARDDEWVPKYRERPVRRKRRFICVATTNNTRNLADPTGERRWLPQRIGLYGQFGIDWVVENRDQLWAEAVELWRSHGGIMWEDAEELAKTKHADFTVVDPWQDDIARWIYGTAEDGFSSAKAFRHLTIPSAQQHPANTARLERVLIRLGFEQDNAGRWWSTLA